MSACNGLRGGTLFSGIGAPECAAPGVDWRWCAEIERFPSAVHAARFPHIPNLGDVTKVKWDEVEPVDVIVFGSPCQSFSIAGKRAGLGDPRGELTLIGLGIVGRLRPRWVVWENVASVLSIDGGRTFGTILGIMGQLGYGFAYRILDARYFGVAQRRRRTFVVGYLGDWRRAAAVLFEREGLSGHPPARGEAREDITGSLAARAGGGGWPDGGDGRHSHLIAHSLRADGFDASEDGTGRGTPLVPVAFSCKDHGADASDIAPTLRAMPHDGSHANAGGQVAVAVSLRGRDGGATAELTDGAAPAIRASQGGGDKPHVLTTAVRRLTPVECERLQGFPDSWTAITFRGKPAADGPRYKALGNSMAVPVMRWLLNNVTAVDFIVDARSDEVAA